MKDLIKLICEAQSGCEEAMVQLIERFAPAINKYYRISNYDADMRSDLQLAFIILVKRINLKNMQIPNEYAIISYVNHSLGFEYIKLIKKRDSERCKIVDGDFSDIIACYQSDVAVEDENYGSFEIMDVMKSVLSPREIFFVKAIVLDGYKAAEIARAMGVSRQYVNQCKNNALRKLRKAIEGEKKNK